MLTPDERKVFRESASEAMRTIERTLKGVEQDLSRPVISQHIFDSCREIMLVVTEWGEELALKHQDALEECGLMDRFDIIGALSERCTLLLEPARKRISPSS